MLNSFLNIFILFVFFTSTLSWFEDFKYRRTILIENFGNDNLTDFDVVIDINTNKLIAATKMKSDCEDVDITLYTPENETHSEQRIPFYLESACDRKRTSFWVRIPKFFPGEIKTVFFYYDDSTISTSRSLKWEDENSVGSLFSFPFVSVSCTGVYGDNGAYNADVFVLGAKKTDTTPVNSPAPWTNYHDNGNNIQCKKEVNVGDWMCLNGANEVLSEVHDHSFTLSAVTTNPGIAPLSMTYRYCNDDGTNKRYVFEHFVAFFDTLDPINDWSDSLDIMINETNNDGLYLFGDATQVGVRFGDHGHYHYAPHSLGTTPSTDSVYIQDTASINAPRSNHLHSIGIQYSYTENDPSYTYLNVRKAEKSTFFVNGMIILGYCTSANPCDPKNPPLGWSYYKNLEGRFPRGTKNPSLLGTIGGKSDHIHTFSVQSATSTATDIGCTHDDPQYLIKTRPPHIHTCEGESTVGTSLPNHKKGYYIQRKKPDEHVAVSVGVEEIECHGVSSIDPNVCSSKGNCSSTDNCDCLPGYLSYSCVYTCHGLWVNSTRVCGGKEQGKCTDWDECTCLDGYFGLQCWEFIPDNTTGMIHHRISIRYEFPDGLVSGTTFNCSDRIINAEIFGSNPICEWDKEQGRMNVTITNPETHRVSIGTVINIKTITDLNEIVNITITEVFPGEDSSSFDWMLIAIISSSSLVLILVTLVVLLLLCICITCCLCLCLKKKKGKDYQDIEMKAGEEGGGEVKVEEEPIPETSKDHPGGDIVVVGEVEVIKKPTRPKVPIKDMRIKKGDLVKDDKNDEVEEKPKPKVEEKKKEKPIQEGIKVKIVMVGDGAVGKTSLLFVYKENYFPEDYLPSVFDNYNKTTEFDHIDGRNRSYDLFLCDTAGQEDYDSIRSLSYEGVDVFILCFSVIDRISFRNIKHKWIPELEKAACSKQIILVGCKEDLRKGANRSSKRVEGPVTREEGIKLCKSIKAHRYMECSAKNNAGCSEIFQMAVTVYEEKLKNPDKYLKKGEKKKKRFSLFRKSIKKE